MSTANPLHTVHTNHTQFDHMDSGEKCTRWCICQSRFYLDHAYNPPLHTVLEHCTSRLVFHEVPFRFSTGVFCGYSKTIPPHLGCPAKYTKITKLYTLVLNDSICSHLVRMFVLLISQQNWSHRNQTGLWLT